MRVDYRPRHVDLRAICRGHYAELVNVVPWNGVSLRLRGVRVNGCHGWGPCTARVLAEWLRDVSANQRHKFVQVRSPGRVSKHTNKSSLT